MTGDHKMLGVEELTDYPLNLFITRPCVHKPSATTTVEGQARSGYTSMLIICPFKLTAQPAGLRAAGAEPCLMVPDRACVSR